MRLVRLLTICLAIAFITLWPNTLSWARDWFASDVISFSRLGNSPYDDPYATLGKPSVWMQTSGAPGDGSPCAVMMICGAWGLGWPQGEKLITTLRPATASNPMGQITVKFASPIYDDPDNWYGKDFIVFGNSFFSLAGAYVYYNSNMEEMILSSLAGQAIWSEPSLVSVSQDGIKWYDYSNGPYADDFAPTHALAWDWVENRWLIDSSGHAVELDFTRPLDPSISRNAFGSISCAAAIDMYKGSGGGTAFDLADLPDLPVDPVTGRKWIQYIRVWGNSGGEVDAFARVSTKLTPITVAEAKFQPDGSEVVLDSCVVSAETYAVSRSCYVTNEGGYDGLRVQGRVFSRGRRYTLYGRMDTNQGERVLLCTAAVDKGQAEPVQPVRLTNSGVGAEWTGSLVRSMGVVVSANAEQGLFVIDDRTGQPVTCYMPRVVPANLYANPTHPSWGADPRSDIPLPRTGECVQVTGIAGMINNQPAIRLRDPNDLSGVPYIKGRISLQGVPPIAVDTIPVTVTISDDQYRTRDTRVIHAGSDGSYLIPVYPGAYRLGFKAGGWLQTVYTHPTAGSVVNVDRIGTDGIDITLLSGDVNGDNVVNMGDYMPMKYAWLSVRGDKTYRLNADLNRDGQINMGDYLLLRRNWLKQGDKLP